MIREIVASHNSSSYIVSVKKLLSESAFLKRAAVRPNSYAWKLAARVYRDIVLKSVDLKRDYDLYYKVEYGDFSKYLRTRHLLRREEAIDIAKTYEKSVAIFRYENPMSFTQCERGVELLQKLLNTKVNQ